MATPDLTNQLRALEEKRTAALAHERIVRGAAFLHTPTTPVLENIYGWLAAPLTLPTYELLRMMNSPFIPPFNTPTPEDTAAFLWVVSPRFRHGDQPAKRKFYRACARQFIASPRRWWETRNSWRTRCATALARHAVIVTKARAFITESMMDRPAARRGLFTEPEYYSDLCSYVGIFAREYGWSESEILQLPLKRLFQYYKEIRATHAAEAGQDALLENQSDDVIDEQLALLNQRN